jgi:transposase
MRHTKDEVARLLGDGMSQAAVARQLGISKATVCYHARTLSIAADARFSRRYDWSAVQAYYDEGHSITACQLRFGFSRKSFVDAQRRGLVRTRPPALPDADFFVAGRRRNGRHVKARLLALGEREDRCELCGIEAWLGEPLPTQLHHVNGDNCDNRLENLQLLCPNCHSQTETWGGRNRRSGAT